MQWRSIKAVLLLAAFILLFAKSSLAYAPNVTGKVTQNTGAPIVGVWVVWDSYELGDAGNSANKGDHKRYQGSDSKGKFTFKSWDSEGVETKGGLVYSNVGKREYEDKINLDYDDANGKEARRSDTNLYDIFNCHNEVNSFSLQLPSTMSNAKVQARWRRDSNMSSTAWSDWEDNKISLPKDEFTNSHDYEVEFRIELPKNASIRDLDKNIQTSQLQSLNSKVPACLKVDLCTDGGKECSNAARTGAGLHRVILSGVGEIQRKLTIGNESKPIWVVECVQRGSAENPNYMCTSGKTDLDKKVFGKDNFSTLKSEFGYSSKMLMSDGVTETSPEVTNTNRQDVYEWETKITPGKKLVSVFMAMYEPENTTPPQSGNQPSQIQATLSNEEGCRLIVDPYGKVYDSYTFEPLSNATVTLNKKRADGTFSKVIQGDVIANLVNPFTTSTNGSYSFIVPAGTYRLEATRDGYKPYKSTDIIQMTEPQQVDIPMEPVNKQKSLDAAKKTPISFEAIFQRIVKEENVLRIEGYVSHPQATITVYTQKIKNKMYVRSSLVGTTIAASDGKFTIEIPYSKVSKGEVIGEVEAVKKGTGVKTKVQLQPLLSGVEGFAVNEAGSTVANAKVGLYINNSDIPVYEVKADNRGFFTIPAASVPDVEYSVRINTESPMPMGTFLSLNNALGATDTMYAQAYSPNNSILGAQDSADSSPSQNTTGIVAVILVIFIFTASALLGIYILQQKKPRRGR